MGSNPTLSATLLCWIFETFQMVGALDGRHVCCVTLQLGPDAGNLGARPRAGLPASLISMRFLLLIALRWGDTG